MTDQVDLSVVVLLLQGLHNVPNIGAAVVVAGRVVALVICQLIVFEVNLNDRELLPQPWTKMVGVDN